MNMFKMIENTGKFLSRRKINSKPRVIADDDKISAIKFIQPTMVGAPQK